MTETSPQKRVRMCLVSAATGAEEQAAPNRTQSTCGCCRTAGWDQRGNPCHRRAWGQGHILLALGKDRGVGLKLEPKVNRGMQHTI